MNVDTITTAIIMTAIMVVTSWCVALDSDYPAIAR